MQSGMARDNIVDWYGARLQELRCSAWNKTKLDQIVITEE